MSDWPWVIVSYALTWGVLGAYALWIRRRLARSRGELEDGWTNSGSSMEVDS